MYINCFKQPHGYNYAQFQIAYYDPASILEITPLKVPAQILSLQNKSTLTLPCEITKSYCGQVTGKFCYEIRVTKSPYRLGP